jgi:hypothetical protein
MSSRRSGKTSVIVLTLALIGLWVFATPTPAIAGPSGVLPASTTLNGYSLTRMAREVALFTTSGNNPTYYPTTPFQILYTQQTAFDPPGNCAPAYTGSCGVVFHDPSGGPAGVFPVKPDTTFYVPIANLDDSPPVIGTYPNTPAGAKIYFFDPLQGGGRDISITIDGTTTLLGSAYVAGPVVSPKPLLDGGGRHIITLGVFVSPLTPGNHTVEIRATQSSPAIRAAYGYDFQRLDFTYDVDVSQG